MKFTRKANAVWKGSGKDGSGTVSTQSSVLDQTQYSFKTRFEDGKGTNPEELIGAAHAGCFAMQLSFLLNEEDYTADELNTDAEVHFQDGEIKKIDLHLTGSVPGISKEDFERIANDAKSVCPISKLLKAEIALSINLK